MEDNYLQIILANTISATNISKILFEHSNSECLNGDHIICGLIYRLMTPMTDNEITESLNDSKNLLNNEYSSDEEDEYLSDEDNTEIINDINSSSIKQKIKLNNCNCEICVQTRVCLHNFNQYIPKDELGDRFKSSIIDTCQKYNKYI